jgi:hypothetical protein
MTLNQYLGTMNWNVVRGLTTLNLKLENDMAEEEKKEFWDDYKIFTETEAGDTKVNALAGMVDALCDYTFVAIGTDSKVAINVVSLNDKIIINALKADMEKQIGLMTGVLHNILGNVFDLDYCYGLVLEANNLKPNKQDPNGKNVKGAEWVDPKTPIKEYLLTLPGIEQYYIAEEDKA